MQIKNGNSIVCDISVVLYGVLLLSFFFLGNNIQSGVYIFHLCFLIILYFFFKVDSNHCTESNILYITYNNYKLLSD